MAFAGILFILIIVLIAIKYSIVSPKGDDLAEDQSIIHTSGIYSIVRKSPREDILSRKPSEQEIRQYLYGKNVDILKNKLTNADKDELLKHWHKFLDNSIKVIEEGDLKGLEFYYYSFNGKDTICDSVIDPGNFITRQDIYDHPELIPPFHLGCNCIIKCHHGVELTKDTSELGMGPFLTDGRVPKLPEWKSILKI